MAMMSVLEFQDPTGEIMVARMPQEGTGEYTMGSQLIVQDGQLAAFYRDGRLTDGFKPGRYSLNTQNLPILTKLLNLPTYGTKSPFRCYLYFIQLKVFTNLGWGTPTPIIFRDSELKAVSLRAHGTFAMRISDPNLFLRTIIGSQGLETTYHIEEYLRRIIVSRFANLLPSLLSSIYDLAQKYKEIEVELKQAVRDDLAQYGLELVDILVEAITVPQEVQEMINRAAGSRALDTSEINRYQALAVSDAIRNSSNSGNSGSGLIDVIGLGAGMALGGQIINNNAVQSSPPPVPAIMKCHVVINGQPCGPHSLETLNSYIQSGHLNSDTLVWCQGMASWMSASNVVEVSQLLCSVKPPPIPE